MLGSAHDGEVAAAGRVAHEIIRRAGATWYDVITPRLDAPPAARAADLSFREVVDLCLSDDAALTDWETEFSHSIRRMRRPLTPRQSACLHRIFIKAGGE
jgi:hypothetical protein